MKNSSDFSLSCPRFYTHKYTLISTKFKEKFECFSLFCPRLHTHKCKLILIYMREKHNYQNDHVGFLLTPHMFYFCFLITLAADYSIRFGIILVNYPTYNSNQVSKFYKSEKLSTLGYRANRARIKKQKSQKLFTSSPMIQDRTPPHLYAF